MDSSTWYFLIVLPFVLFSVTLHEVAHGWCAYKLGDPTAKYMGRLTLNPIKHLDPVGSLLLPFILFRLGLPVFGMAKPVPVDFRRLRDQRIGYILVGLSGPLANLALAIVIGLIIRFIPLFFLHDLLEFVFVINMILALFNLIPFPPLDGSRVVLGFLSPQNRMAVHKLERFGIIILMVLVLSGALSSVFHNFFLPIIGHSYYLITGHPLSL